MRKLQVLVRSQEVGKGRVRHRPCPRACLAAGSRLGLPDILSLPQSITCTHTNSSLCAKGKPKRQTSQGAGDQSQSLIGSFEAAALLAEVPP